MFLYGDPVEGRFKLRGPPVTVEDVKGSKSAARTEPDRTAPGRSVYKIHLSIEAEVTFVLTSAGTVPESSTNRDIATEAARSSERHWRHAALPRRQIGAGKALENTGIPQLL